jgi:peptidylprolyl isomerase
MKNIKHLTLVLVSTLVFNSCSKEPKIEEGSLVTLNYTGTLKDGEVFDTTSGKQPFKFLVGSGTVLPAFEKEIVMMEEGAKKKFKIKAKDAYQHDPKLIGEVPRDSRFDGIELKEGAIISASRSLPNGEMQKFPVKVIEATEETVKLDYNPPIVGKDLYFEVELVDLEVPEEAVQAEASEQEPVQAELSGEGSADGAEEAASEKSEK